MRADEFAPDAPGRLVETGGLPAFIPDELPPDIELPVHLFQLAAEVSGEIGRLDGTARALPDRTLLIRSFIRREAQLSSYIEGTFADYGEVAGADAAEEKRQRVAYRVRETLNAERAITAGIRAVSEQGMPITLALIRQLHEILLEDVEGHDCRGRYRKVQVYIGNRALGPDYARFVPPPPTFVPELMEQHHQYLTNDDGMPIPIRLALLHYHFETIHPFDDGNGRLGRTLILMAMCQTGLLTVPVFNPSLTLERHRDTYYDSLLGISTRGRWLEWIEFFLRSLRDAAVESAAKVREVLVLAANYQEIVRDLKMSAAAAHTVERLLIDPIVTVQQVTRWTGETAPTARKNLNKLVDAGILRLIDGKPQRFRAETIIKVLDPVPTRR